MCYILNMTTATVPKKLIRGKINTTNAKIVKKYIYQLITPEERLMIWERVRGIWKNRKRDPLQELKKMRKEWERKIS